MSYLENRVHQDILSGKSTSMIRPLFVFTIFALTNSQVVAQEIIDPSNHNEQNTSHSNFSTDSSWRPEIFSLNEVERMKQFIVRNASMPEQPKGSLWNKNYRHKCINTVRAGLEILLFGSSSIPDSLYSRLPVFNGDFQTNDVQSLALRLVHNNYLSKPDTLLFNARNRGEWVSIQKNNEQTRYLRPMELRGSLWHTLLGNIGKVKGYSVFVISVCDGNHTAILTVDHRNLEKPVVYWSDQTHKHPYRYFKEDKLIEVQGKYGWEVMLSCGVDTLARGVPRGLDEYTVYAVNKYWCDCNRENQKPEDCCRGNCFPLIQIWRVIKSKTAWFQ